MRSVNAAITVAGAATGDLSASFNSDPFLVNRIKQGSIQLAISAAAALNGTVRLQMSNDPGTLPGVGPVTGVTNWVDINGTTKAVAANGPDAWGMTDIGYRWVRIVYTRTAGTGTIAFRIEGKGDS